jgi:hypothetical protein
MEIAKIITRFSQLLNFCYSQKQRLMRNSKNTQIQVSPIPKQVTAMFLLWALLIVVFAPTFSLAETNKAPTGMVYCPLSRRFQPINPPEEKKEFKPFGNICASNDTKDFLFREILIENPFRRISFDENKLDDLAFNFLAHGESALRELPNLPNLPSENLIKQIGSSLVINNTYDHQFVWKQPAQYYSPALLARPPTAAITAIFTSNLVHQSDELSRSVAPRAPPVRS